MEPISDETRQCLHEPQNDACASLVDPYANGEDKDQAAGALSPKDVVVTDVTFFMIRLSNRLSQRFTLTRRLKSTAKRVS